MTNHLYKKAFTIVELVVVVAVIVILSTIAYISYVGWKERIAVTQITSNLKAAASAMEQEKNFNNAYPTSLPSSFTPDGDTTIIGGSDGNGGYCLEAEVFGMSGSYNITNIKGETSEAAAGNCKLRFKKVATGNYHHCALSFNNKVYCYGQNNEGQLGVGNFINRNSYAEIKMTGVLSGLTILDLAVADGHSCVIASNNRPYCWGNGANGRLGNGLFTNQNEPVAVNVAGVLSGKKLVKIYTGGTAGSFGCTLDSDGKAYCWGADNTNQLGNGGASIDSALPTAVDTTGVLAGKIIEELFTKNATSHTCARTTEDRYYCWGNNGYGRLGDGTSNARTSPIEVSVQGAMAGKTIKSISPGSYHTCVIASDDKAYCWGRNISGELGDGGTTSSLVPVAVTTTGVLSGKTIANFTSGYLDNCAIDSDGNAYCWGGWDACGANNNCGTLGHGLFTHSLVPVSVVMDVALAGKKLLTVCPGVYSTLALGSDYQIYSWGVISGSTPSQRSNIDLY